MSKKGLVLGVVVAVAVVAVVGGVFTVKSVERIGTGKLGVQYSVNGIKEETLSEGWHFINPFLKIKEFSIGNEQLVLEKGKEDNSIKVATSDDASISVSFQMSYRYKPEEPEEVVSTYKKFRGMDGEDIVDQRVKSVLKSKISEVTSGYSMMDVYSGSRTEINNKITEYLNEVFGKEYGIEVLDASIIDVHPDDKLKESIDARVKALQEKQQAEAEQEKVKVQKETEKIQAEADAQIEITKAKAEAEANRLKSESITDELIRMKEAEAHMEHGFVTVNGANTVVTDK